MPKLHNSQVEGEGKLPQPKRPNILITGTPGTGKTSTSEMLAESCGYTHINVSELVKNKSLHKGKDEEWDSYTLDEDKVVDELEERMVNGGNIVDFHSCAFFPERWFHLVIVLRATTDKLFDRLQARKYKKKKLDENMEAEIMQVVLDEAKESYKKGIIVELKSDSVEDMEGNVQRICEWIKKNDKNGQAESKGSSSSS
eukprot:jgi/Bigna1/90161/estExt_fgenesh1_pg.C_640014